MITRSITNGGTEVRGGLQRRIGSRWEGSSSLNRQLYPGANRLDVFGLGTDSGMWHKAWDGSSWHPSLTGWESLGGVGAFHGSPAVAAWGPNRLDLFAVIRINEIYHKAWDGSAWQPSPTLWDALGGTVNSSPAVVAPAANNLSVFAVGAPNNDLIIKSWNNGAWQPSMTDWTSLGGVLDSPPAVAFWSSLDIHAFALGTDDQMYQLSLFGRFPAGFPANTWEALGGLFHSAPAAVSWGEDRLDVFGIGTDYQMYHKFWNGKLWEPSQADWEALGGVFDLPRVEAWP